VALTKVGKEGVTGISNSSNATAITIDSSENVGISNTTPGSYYSNSNQLVVGSGSARQGITIASSTSTIGQLAFADGTSGDARFEGWVIYDHNTDHMSFGTSADERMRIDSSGNVGIGTSSPAQKLHIEDTSASVRQRFVTGTSNQVSIDFGDTDSGTAGRIQYDHATNALSFNTDATERMRIISNGFVLIGTTTNGGEGFSFGSTGFLTHHRASGAAQSMVGYKNGGNFVGEVRTSTTATSYITSSDYRLKENVTYDWDATTRLKQLKPARFNFIIDPNKTVDGFLAHEVTAVPEAISGTKDEVEVWKDGEELPDGVSAGDNKLDENGNTIPVMQGIDQSKLVPLLVKTIIELEARITALEAE